MENYEFDDESKLEIIIENYEFDNQHMNSSYFKYYSELDRYPKLKDAMDDLLQVFPTLRDTVNEYEKKYENDWTKLITYLLWIKFA